MALQLLCSGNIMPVRGNVNLLAVCRLNMDPGQFFVVLLGQGRVQGREGAGMGLSRVGRGPGGACVQGMVGLASSI